jgi:hypothetical protein
VALQIQTLTKREHRPFVNACANLCHNRATYLTAIFCSPLASHPVAQCLWNTQREGSVGDYGIESRSRT